MEWLRRTGFLVILLMLGFAGGLSYADLPVDMSEPEFYPDRYKLSMIRVHGTDLPGFNKNVLNYTYTMTSSEAAMMKDHYGNYVEALKIDPYSTVIKSTVENRVNLIVNYSTDPDYLLYTVTFVEGSSSGDSSGGQNVIDRENNKLLNQALEGTDSPNDTARILDSLAAITAEIKRDRTSKISDQDYLRIIKTLEHLAGLMNRVEDKDAVLKGIAELTDAARNLVIRIDDADRTTALTVQYLGKLSLVMNQVDSNTMNGAKLKNNSRGLAAEALDKAGTVFLTEDRLSRQGTKATVEFDGTEIDTQLTKARGAYNQLDGALSTLMGSADPRNLVLTLTVNTPRPTGVTDVEGTLPEGSLASIRNASFDRIRFKLGETGLSVPVASLQQEGGPVRMNAVLATMPTGGFPSGSRNLTDGYVTDITLVNDTGEIQTFLTPASLTLDLTEAMLTGILASDYNKLTAFRLDPDTGIWVPVGGIYDAITGKIRINRLHLSKYTVLKTDKTFNDVEYSWARNDINALLGKGIISDTSAFNPKGELTREDFARWIAKAYELESDGASLPFTDVPKSHPYYRELAAAYSQGLIKGKSSTAFDPKGRITRQEMATLISNALIRYNKATTDSSLTAKLNKYPDSGKIAGWAKNNVALVNELGIMQGDTRGFRPTDFITREEAAVVLMRIYN